MPTAVLTPFARSAARRTGERWRKRLLPVGTVNYKGRALSFDPGYLGKLAEAFSNRAYDYVPFQLAGDSNLHTNDVERYAGRVEGMQVDMGGPDGPGLYIDLIPTERGKQALALNPMLGVSARIVEEYDRADGKFFPAAVQHVLATHDPRIPGLGGWRAIDAAGDGVIVTVDLSGARFDGDTEGTGTMPEYTPEQQAKLAKLLDLPSEQFDQLLAGLTAPVLSAEELAALEGSTGGDAELTDEELAEMIAAMPDEDFAAMQEQFQRETAGAGAGAGAGTGLSNDAMLALELTNARADETEAQLSQVQQHLDRERWLAERRSYLDMGIPAYVVDEGQALLLGSGHVVDLANGQGVDAGAVMRKVLGKVGDLLSGLGLQPGIELGSPLDEPEQHKQGAEARAGVVSAFRSQTGI